MKKSLEDIVVEHAAWIDAQNLLIFELKALLLETTRVCDTMSQRIQHLEALNEQRRN